MPGDTARVRSGEELDVPALAAYLRDKIPGVAEGLDVEQFPGGYSNLTYLLRCGGEEFVLRRPPLGPVAPKAHDMAREYRVLNSVSLHFNPAPKAFLISDDPSIVGAPFFVMERRRGVVLRREWPADYPAGPEIFRRVSEAFTDCLIELHSVDIFRHGLDSLGRPEGFLERQLQGWATRWQRAKTEELPQMDQLGDWLGKHMPISGTATIVHNDYKLDNLMLASEDAAQITAVLDWEMATVGDPLVDLGVVLSYWPESGDPEARREAVSPITTHPGFYSRRQLLERYAAVTGRDLSRIDYYEVFGLYKLAVVLQQIYYRYYVGQTQDPRFHDLPQRVRGLADAALLVMERAR